MKFKCKLIEIILWMDRRAFAYLKEITIYLN